MPRNLCTSVRNHVTITDRKIWQIIADPEVYKVRLRTKLIITGVTIVILPLALTAAAFVGIGTAMTHDKQNAFNRGVVLDNDENYQQTAEDIFTKVETDRKKDPAILEKTDYLDGINK